MLLQMEMVLTIIIRHVSPSLVYWGILEASKVGLL